MRDLVSGVLTRSFQTSSVPKKAKPNKNRPAPLSIRLSDDERAQLQDWAGRTPLSSYVKACLFEGKKPRRAKAGDTAKDFEALARLLAALGKTDAFRNLDQLVQMAEAGTLELSDEHVQTILAACLCVTDMRNELMRALGLKG